MISPVHLVLVTSLWCREWLCIFVIPFVVTKIFINDFEISSIKIRMRFFNIVFHQNQWEEGGGPTMTYVSINWWIFTIATEVVIIHWRNIINNLLFTHSE